MNELSRLPVTLKALTDPSTTALLVIDMQNDFISCKGFSAQHGGDVSSSRAIIPSINRLIRAVREAGTKVYYIRTTHSLETDSCSYKARYALRQIDVSKGLICQEGTWGAEIDSEITPPVGKERTLTKYSYDAFLGTDLDAILRGQCIQSVITVGVNTNVCVQATAEHAFGLGYHLVVPEDCVAGSTEKAHQAALDNIRVFFGSVVTSQQIMDVWDV